MMFVLQSIRSLVRLVAWQDHYSLSVQSWLGFKGREVGW